MMITLFTIVHYRYHPTPDTREEEREVMAKGMREGKRISPSLVGFVVQREVLPLMTAAAADN